ncbi:alpha/beta-hydrolase [Aspergillus crustosus]
MPYKSTLATICGLVPFVSGALYHSVIETKYGAVQGYPAFNSSHTGNLTHWKDITVWQGIPFAATTGGQNRWKAPQPASAWNGTLDAKSWGDVCPSATGGNNNYTISEDCLNLNIWSPATSTDAKLPVVMWSYPAGSTGADALFDGGGMADQELTEEFDNGHNSSGNWGMLDHFAALKWIKTNIADFSGDPDHITVMGQSAGSAATQHILNSPLTKGLITGAIIQSGVRDPQDPLCMSAAESYATLDSSYATASSYLQSLNVSTLAEARELPMESLVTDFLSSAYELTATLDYYAIPDTYYNTLEKKLAQDVPIITGNTKNKTGTTYGLDISVLDYLADLNETYSGVWIQRFLDLYPAHDNTTASGAHNSQFTDRSKVGTWLWSQMWNAAYTSPIYNYYWDHAPPGQNQGAYHESEINYVLNNLYATDKAWAAEDYAIAKKMNTYWANFIKYGDPNGNGLTDWPPVNSTGLVQHVGDGWGQIPVALSRKVALFKAWFSTLQKY